MSTYIPSVVQIKIFCHLPVKSLIRCRSVSKEWKTLIDSSEFKSRYIVHQQDQRRRLVLLGDEYDGSHCWIVDDDDSFPQHKISLRYYRFFNRLLNINQIKVVGSSYGLLCFTCRYLSEDNNDYFNRYVIWNPSIRKSVAIDAPYNKHVNVGFGVCPNTLDPKIVKINIIKVSATDFRYDDDLKLYVNRVWRVEVFTLSEGVWRSPLTKLPRKWFNIDCYKTPLVINGFIYWCVDIYSDNRCSTNAIVSFDLGSEEFAKVQLPSDLGKKDINIFNLKNSLGVVQINYKEGVHNVWSMDHVSKLFTKLFSVTLPKRSKVVGSRDDDQLIIEKMDDRYEVDLVAYEPNLEQFNNLGLYVHCSSVSSYTESLLMLDQSGTLNDDEGDDEGYDEGYYEDYYDYEVYDDDESDD